jgi:hypothetical protein
VRVRAGEVLPEAPRPGPGRDLPQQHVAASAPEAMRGRRKGHGMSMSCRGAGERRWSA